MFSRPARLSVAAAIPLLAAIALPTASFAQVSGAQTAHAGSAAAMSLGTSSMARANLAPRTGPLDVAAPLVFRATTQCRTAPLDPSGTGTKDCSATTNSTGCTGIRSCLLSLTVNTACPVPRRTLGCGGSGGILGRSPFIVWIVTSMQTKTGGAAFGLGYYSTPTGVSPAFIWIYVTDTDTPNGTGDVDTVTLQIAPGVPFQAASASFTAHATQPAFTPVTATWTCTRPSQTCYVETLGPGAGTSG